MFIVAGEFKFKGKPLTMCLVNGELYVHTVEGGVFATHPDNVEYMEV